MIKTISKVGNSQGVIFDAALMERALCRLKEAFRLSRRSSGGRAVDKQ